jgi:hypothetical protein
MTFDVVMKSFSHLKLVEAATFFATELDIN